MKDENFGIKEFEKMIAMAELRALSKLSLTQPLTNNQFKRMMELKDRIFSEVEI